ncbi:MAG: sodium ion-translocating decarboxylase subunit beta [Lachnospiraceae bacterium]|nr:sodium ion-translocating decarboxylase subunit beta [Lachnospiraceae bacterium]MBQ3979918.1 sodium ion-translocating decarboxylase subunit beta [Lachnospiraceae bacterium]MCR5375659.1 sodium ion-translocating decarboxylase subunit beta [Lachnospiraceae bacterium]
MQYILDTLGNLAKSTAFASLSWGNLLMICVALFFMYLAIAKDYEPLLLVPISFGMLLVNMYPSIMAKPVDHVYTYYDEQNEKILEFKDEEVTFFTYDKDDIAKYVVDSTGTYDLSDLSEDELRLTTVRIVYVSKTEDQLLFTYSKVNGECQDYMCPIASRCEDTKQAGGLLYYFFQLDEWAILPCLIFMGVGAMTDFGPLIANPKSFLLGAAAQLGIFFAYLSAIFLGFNDKAAAAISIIGGADGPTSIFLAMKLGQTEYMGAIAVAAYSYMSLVPIIQPPIMKLLTTEKERKIKMEQLRPVSKLEKILFPIIVTIVVVALLPDTAPLIGCLMLGNIFRESGVVRQLQETASNAMMYIVVIILGTSVGATTSAEAFLKLDTLKIVALGLIAFAIGTAGGVLFGKIMCKATHGKINPLIGSAGVSAVPMAARVSQKVGAEADPSNFLLMHAMGPNVAGVIGTAVAAGVFMAVFGV